MSQQKRRHRVVVEVTFDRACTEHTAVHQAKMHLQRHFASTITGVMKVQDVKEFSRVYRAYLKTSTELRHSFALGWHAARARCKSIVATCQSSFEISMTPIQVASIITNDHINHIEEGTKVPQFPEKGL